MVKIKTSEAALSKLQKKGVTVNIVKKGEAPAPSLNQPVKEVVAAPKIKQENTNTPKVREIKSRQWELEVDSRDFQGYIKTLTITEI